MYIYWCGVRPNSGYDRIVTISLSVFSLKQSFSHFLFSPSMKLRWETTDYFPKAIKWAKPVLTLKHIFDHQKWLLFLNKFISQILHQLNKNFSFSWVWRVAYSIKIELYFSTIVDTILIPCFHAEYFTVGIYWAFFSLLWCFVCRKSNVPVVNWLKSFTQREFVF
jgi:hypothetical protein